ncbi:MAG TPA: adenylate/guanylate cyclase domain-containing protein [Steroidobacteraceae bacterium]|nr:adenylate/guanylate cyclase domain-containing protein [Steroidobacteraceae bacterium]
MITVAHYSVRGKPLIPGLTSLDVAGATCATAVFADLHGYDALLEPLHSVEVAQLLGELFEVLTGAVLEYGGQIFALQEAGMLAGFGVGDTRHARTWEAFNAARAMQQRFADVRARWQKYHSIDTALGVGIHRGEVAVGLFGPAQQASLLLVGDAANGAAQLARRARAGEILLSSAACGPERGGAAGLAPPRSLKRLPPLQLRGRSAPLDVWCAPAAQRLTMRPAWGRRGAH